MAVNSGYPAAYRVSGTIPDRLVDEGGAIPRDVPVTGKEH
jgi:hypothetical protein